MPAKSLGRSEERAHIILFMGFIIVLFWHGVWGMADELEVNTREVYGHPKIYFNLVTIAFVVIMIWIFPRILYKI